MKKIILCLFVLMLLTGCGKKETMKLECELSATTIVLTIQEGKITKYVDKISGEASNKEIEVLNNSYLSEINDNKKAASKMIEVIASNGGDCKQYKE